eukprot:SAG31_NODE_5822_length_2309_cov_1.138009_2_plen_160_part_00
MQTNVLTAHATADQRSLVRCDCCPLSLGPAIPAILRDRHESIRRCQHFPRHAASGCQSNVSSSCGSLPLRVTLRAKRLTKQLVNNVLTGDNSHRVLSVHAALPQRELIFGLSFGDLIPAEPLADGRNGSGQLVLDICYIVKPRGQRIFAIYGHHLRMCM